MADEPAAAPAALAELDRARTAFVADCLAIVARQAEEDPGLARRALRAASAVAPRDPGVLAWVERLGVPPTPTGPGPSTDAPPWANAWTDLLTDRTFGRLSAEGTLLLPAGPSAYARPSRSLATGGRYVLEMEFRQTSVREGARAMCGFVLGTSSGRSLSLFLCEGRAVADEDVEGRVETRANAELTSPDLTAWRRLVAVSEPEGVRLWLDGQPVLPRLVPTVGEVGGGFSLLHAGCSLEVRRLRWGRAE